MRPLFGMEELGLRPAWLYTPHKPCAKAGNLAVVKRSPVSLPHMDDDTWLRMESIKAGWENLLLNRIP